MPMTKEERAAAKAAKAAQKAAEKERKAAEKAAKKAAKALAKRHKSWTKLLKAKDPAIVLDALANQARDFPFVRSLALPFLLKLLKHKQPDVVAATAKAFAYFLDPQVSDVPLGDDGQPPSIPQPPDKDGNEVPPIPVALPDPKPTDGTHHHHHNVHQ